MTTQQTDGVAVVTYLKALCHVNDWDSIRIRHTNGEVLVYTKGKGAELVGKNMGIPDDEITGWEALAEEAKDL